MDTTYCWRVYCIILYSTLVPMTYRRGGMKNPEDLEVSFIEINEWMNGTVHKNHGKIYE